MATGNFYDRDNSESMIMHRPDSGTHYIKEIISMEKQNGVENNASHSKNTDQGKNVTNDISKTVEMLLVEEQNLQGIAAKSDSRERTPDNSVLENIDIEMKDTKSIHVPDASKCDLSKQKSPKKMQPNLICEICGAGVSRSTGMKHHLLAHTDLRPFSCKSCSFTFKDPVSLRRHVNTHNPDYIHLCDICGKSFSRREHLKNHKYLHTSNNPYICQTCNKQFTRSDHLMRHLLIHSGEKKFSCSYCEKKFGKRYQLTEHMYTHGKEKPLKCESCDYACVRPSELKQHMERVHVLGCDKRVLGTKKQDIEQPLKCVYCDFRCTGSLEFEQHRQCVHSLGELNYFKTRQSVQIKNRK